MFKVLFAVLAFASFTAHAETSYYYANCFAQGNNVGGNDNGPFTSDSRMSITLAKAEDESLSLRAEGVFMIANSIAEGLTAPILTPNNSYIAMFDVNLDENPNYRPTTYRGYAQFKDFDSNTTIGQESGMWGYLAVDKAFVSQKTFRAVYVFQAGDHLGGSLFFTCTNTAQF